MNEQKTTDLNSASLVEMLASKDGMIRQKGREALVALGTPAGPSLYSRPAEFHLGSNPLGSSQSPRLYQRPQVAATVGKSARRQRP